MPPSRWLKSPACAKPQAMAMEPSAVTIHESREIAPTWAMLVGSMMMPEPIMLTATMNVSCTTFIFLAVGAVSPLTVALLTSPLDRVGEELDAVIDPLLIDARNVVGDAGTAVETTLCVLLPPGSYPDLFALRRAMGPGGAPGLGFLLPRRGGLLGPRRRQAVDVVDPVPFLGALDLLCEPGETVPVLLQRAQVGEPGPVLLADVLSRHDDRDAGRVGNHADGDDPAGHVIERDLFRVPGHQLLEGAARGHLRSGQAGIGLGLPVALPAALHVRPHLVRQILEPHAGVAIGSRRHDVGEHLAERGVPVVVVL